MTEFCFLIDLEIKVLARLVSPEATKLGFKPGYLFCVSSLGLPLCMSFLLNYLSKGNLELVFQHMYICVCIRGTIQSITPGHRKHVTLKSRVSELL
jgi:hypothetical protein